MRLKVKFRLFIGVALLGLGTLATLWLWGERSRLFAQKQEKARNLVETCTSIAMRYQQREQAGKMSRQEAQAHALEEIGSLRYEGDNYFWVNDLHPTMIMHPMKPQLNGKDLAEFKDPKGKALFVAMVEAVRRDGSGFVSYMWPKPGKNEPVPKISFVKGFEPWGWVIGTGIYVDDVDAIWYQDAKVAGCAALACAIILVLASMWTYRSIFGRLAQVVDRLKDIAQGDGDLTRRLEVSSSDELAEVARWFNTFVEKLHHIIAEVADNTQSLAQAGKEISASCRGQANGAETQKDQTAQVATAMAEMAATVQQISEHSNTAAAASQKACETARQGGKIVEETLDRMRAITDSVGDAAKKVAELGKRSEQIGRISGVIDDIADQTNLLALNAAIEAARAGEQGRGFAVVADEVRKLAERTSTATKEIADMIRGMQAETKNGVAAIQDGTRQVELGVKSTSEAGSSLHDIIQMTEQVGDMISHIATAATQQAAATEQINSSVERIATIAGSAVVELQQTAQSVDELSSLSFSLRELVGQFRLQSNAPGHPAPAQRQAAATAG